MTHYAIEVSKLGKRYTIGAPPVRNRNLREVLLHTAAAPVRNLRRLRSHGRGGSDGPTTLWALSDVSFAIQPGEVVGLVGRNGSGKSTLLKVLSRITNPTAGFADVEGRVGSLLEVGTGFHPELTGRDNVYLNGAILGMSRMETRRRFDEIVEFAGIGAFIDTPVKRYSSGMYVRLAFAVAAHLEPEIMILDEVLAVGDAEFQNKCLSKMDEVARSGRTVLFVSHNLPSIQRLCPRSIMLDAGRIVADGPTKDVLNQYLAVGAREAQPGHWIELTDAKRTGSGAATFSGIRYSSHSDVHDLRPFTGGGVEFELTVRARAPQPVVSLAVSIANQSGTNLVNADTSTLDDSVSLREGESTWRITIDRLFLKPGRYTVGLWLGGRTGEPLDRIESAFRLEVMDAMPGRRAVRLDSRYDGVVACDFNVAEVA
jgi:lipopolysaccharide transport system ATP-binding protein